MSAFPIELPPLRDRGEDIIRLAEFFLERSAREIGKPVPALSPEAKDRVLAYAWPGNVRELENMMERAAILSEGEVEAGDLDIDGDAPSRPVRFREIERNAIEAALPDNGGNRTRAAQPARNQPADFAVPAEGLRHQLRRVPPNTSAAERNVLACASAVSSMGFE